MPHCHFDCLANGVLYPDAFGVDLHVDQIADQTHAVLLNIVGEMTNDRDAISICVTVRGERGDIIYVAQGLISAGFVQKNEVG